MDHWDLATLDVAPRQPLVLQSEDEGRAIAIQLPAGEALEDHEVHERAWLVVIDGTVEIDGTGATVRGGPGTLAVFAPHERHEVRALEDARLLLMLAPWPGEGRRMGDRLTREGRV